MARKKAEKSGLFKDIVTLAKSGWTPDECNALLDRLEQIGDPLEPLPADEGDEGEDNDRDENLEDQDEDNDESDADESDESKDDEDDDQDEDDEAEDAAANLSKMKKTGLQVENERLKKEIKRLQQVNKNKDVSGVVKKSNKSPEDSLIDAFQSCF